MTLRPAKEKFEASADIVAPALFLHGAQDRMVPSAPLPEQYGWGDHVGTKGETALHGAESEAYQAFSANAVRRLKAMRSSRASRKEI